MPLPPLPPSSLAYRTHLAHLLSSLRRTRPRVPFWHLAAHRIPTLWLYRSLLREAPGEVIRGWMRDRWRVGKAGTSPQGVREELEEGYRMLDVFRKAKEGDERWRRVLERYARLIAGKRHKAEWKAVEAGELQRLRQLARRPMLTGTLVPATLYNRPLPRLKPQPPAIGAMIRRRIRVRELRRETALRHVEWRSYARDEARAEEMLGLGRGRRSGVFGGQGVLREWEKPINDHLTQIAASFTLEEARLKSRPSPQLLETLRAARQERKANLTRAKRRELRGEITNRVLKRMRQRPPARVLGRMTEFQKRRDRIVREPSWGGYAGRLKRKMGMVPPKGHEHLPLD